MGNFAIPDDEFSHAEAELAAVLDGFSSTLDAVAGLIIVPLADGTVLFLAACAVRGTAGRW